MSSISVFDMLKIGVGPSSSHTLGPWRAAEMWISSLKDTGYFDQVNSVQIDLYGSLSLTGKGHATDIAIVLGLIGADPITFDTHQIEKTIQQIKAKHSITLNGERSIAFNYDEHIRFLRDFLPFHPNGLTFTASIKNGVSISNTYYSIGGGFVSKEGDDEIIVDQKILPNPIYNSKQLIDYCNIENSAISDIVFNNELSWRTPCEIDEELLQVWQVMLHSMYDGCHTQGVLPGGLNVKRRAFDIHSKLIGDIPYNNPEEWINAIRNTEVKFRQILKWVSCFALAVNEINASLGRVVTAPTNGSAGVIPAVLMYYLVIENHQANFNHIKKFLLVAGEIGCIFKKNATISAAMGGCQAEIGVSSAMAAGALTELLGGTPEQVTIAAEIAMEHHLGLTCDPIGGLVQVPCIERNSMGAIKAISAAELALETNPDSVKVSLDKVIATMWQTAKDMHHNYKETSEGGLAIAVNLTDC